MLPQLFVDVRKLKGELMLRTSVPSVARSLSKVIFHSRDSAFQYECMRILSDLVTRTHSDSNYYDCGVSGGAAECSRGDQEVLELQALQDAATDAILGIPSEHYPCMLVDSDSNFTLLLNVHLLCVHRCDPEASSPREAVSRATE
jgi:hypothetical protein